jgi:hypothetical protein
MFRKFRVCPILGSPKKLNSRNLLSVSYDQRISKRNGMPLKDILKAAVAAVGEKIRKLKIRQLLQADAKKRQTDAFKMKLSSFKSEKTV